MILGILDVNTALLAEQFSVIHNRILSVDVLVAFSRACQNNHLITYEIYTNYSITKRELLSRVSIAVEPSLDALLSVRLTLLPSRLSKWQAERFLAA